jgi:hypothetical protein
VKPAEGVKKGSLGKGVVLHATEDCFLIPPPQIWIKLMKKGKANKMLFPFSYINLFLIHNIYMVDLFHIFLLSFFIAIEISLLISE